MIFNRHLACEGQHAIFSASQSAWLRYTDEHAFEVYENLKAKELGTKLHEWACNTIKLKIKQPRSEKTLYAYVNDAIGFHMKPETVLYYSDMFFGTADAISFRNGELRIHDLKTGKGPVHKEQLEVYAALFCLEYHIEPTNIKIILRIYQNDSIEEWMPEPEEILHVMDRIVHLDKLMRDYRNGEDE